MFQNATHSLATPRGGTGQQIKMLQVKIALVWVAVVNRREITPKWPPKWLHQGSMSWNSRSGAASSFNASNTSLLALVKNSKTSDSRHAALWQDFH